MKRFVAGFMFDGFFESVLLIEKKTPEWQRGLWNGVGGKIEPGETPIEAMIREFQEETGIETTAREWDHMIVLRSRYGHFQVDFFRCESGEKLHGWDGTSPTEEHLSIWDINRLQDCPTIRNLSWIIPLLMDPDIEGPVEIIHR